MRLSDFDLNFARHAAAHRYYDPERDMMNSRRLGDTRKERLTLRDINRLKKQRQMDASVRQDHLALVARMYGGTVDDAIEAEVDVIDLRRKAVGLAKAQVDLATARLKRAGFDQNQEPPHHEKKTMQELTARLRKGRIEAGS
jgi:hypothetical protein